MLNPFYTLIKQRLATITQLKEIAWYMQQYKGTSSAMTVTPVTYVEVLPFETQSQSHKAVEALVSFRLHTVGTMLKTDDSRLADTVATDHLKLVDTVYEKIHGYQALLSAIPSYEANANTKRDYYVINSVQRTNITPDHNWAGKLVTVQEFKTLVRWRGNLPATAPVVGETEAGITIEIENPGS